MTLTDSFLENLAKAIAAESYDTISHFSIGETTTASIDPTLTILAGEAGTRVSNSAARVDNSIEFSGTRSGTDVADTVNGDDIKTFGTNTDLSGSTLQGGVVVGGVTHTTAFDIDFLVTIEVVR